MQSFLRRLAMPQRELEDFYRNRRKMRYETGYQLKGIQLRKVVHPIVVGAVKLDKLLKRRELTVLHDYREKTDKPVVYACTHIGRYDVETNLETIKEDAYIFMGNPGHMYKDPLGILLWMNGVVFADLDDKADRHIALETGIQILQRGGNIMIFPEGAWNITENLPVLPLFSGAVEMGIRGGAVIVPVATEQYGNRFYVNIGKAIDCSGWMLDKKKAYTSELRDIMATLKWEIWEQFPITKRAGMSERAAEEFVDAIMAETTNDYSVEEINSTRYRDKNIVEPDEAFAYLGEIRRKYINEEQKFDRLSIH